MGLSPRGKACFRASDMDKYKLMRMAENLEEDAIKFDEVDEAFPTAESGSAEEFKKKYKEFYTDIKISIKEDW